MTQLKFFRKKPVTVSAVQWDGTYSHAKRLEVELGLSTLSMTAHPTNDTCSHWKVYLLTHNDDQCVHPLDWIVTTSGDEYWLINPAEFGRLYDPLPGIVRSVEPPTTPEQIREFIGTNASSMTFENAPADDSNLTAYLNCEASENDMYSVSAHDLLSSFSDWHDNFQPAFGDRINTIKSMTDYKSALTEVSNLIDINPEEGTPGSDRLIVLSMMIETFENKLVDMSFSIS